MVPQKFCEGHSALVKPLEEPQRIVKIKKKLTVFSLRPSSGREGLKLANSGITWNLSAKLKWAQHDTIKLNISRSSNIGQKCVITLITHFEILFTSVKLNPLQYIGLHKLLAG